MKYPLVVFTLFSFCLASAQDFSSLIDTYFEENRAELQITAQDVADTKIYNQSFSKQSRVHHVYVAQRYQGIEVFNAVANFTIREDRVLSMKNNFTAQLTQKVNTTTPQLSPQDAIFRAAEQLKLAPPSDLEAKEATSENAYLFSKAGISQEDIPVQLVLQPNKEKTALRLAWDLSILQLDGKHWYSVRIDAVSGDLLQTHDWMSQCTFDAPNGSVQKSHTHDQSILFEEFASSTPNDGSQYRVFPMPVESPNHGSDQVVVEPANPLASPYGWHDIDGVAGEEFTDTRGNNVRARADLSGNNTGDFAEASSNLEFDFDYNLQQNPLGYTDASIVNLFYWNNINHDVWYQYGFDEESGNFQENNYENGGNANDPVDADAQDGSGTNNANFGTPPDGFRPRMQMFLWSPSGPPGNPLTINDGALAGDYFGEEANFGPGLPTTPITADLVLIEDDDSGPSTDPYDGCDAITNATDLDEKIVVIRRGECEFGFKVLAAENEGALAVIVVNNEPGDPIGMGPGSDGDDVTIPSIMVDQTDGDAIIAALENGETINASLEAAGPFPFDSALDSGVITHEYGHGISNRLTAGPAAAGCLQNAEQMGEGWSDWFGLMLTLKEEDVPEQPKGIGTFLIGQPTDGNGIRPAPYSTSFSENPLTYDHTNNGNISQPHGIGTVWATMLWDMTWALIDEHGFDTDIYNGTGGNNIAMHLVIEGLKLQGCEPGFVDGRDAILEADELLYDGENECLIWHAFANRGLGVSATQGSSDDRFDQEEAFDVPEACSLGTGSTSKEDFIIYPNPSEGDIHIVPNVQLGASTVRVYDTNGREVFVDKVTLNQTTNLQLGSLSPGMYFIEIKGETRSYTQKLLIK